MQRENKCNCSAEYPHDQLAHNGHTANFMQRENKWQERFEKEFCDRNIMNVLCWKFKYEEDPPSPYKIKSFIQSEIDTVIAERDKKIIHILKINKVTEDEDNENWEEENWIINQHIDNIIKELTGK